MKRREFSLAAAGLAALPSLVRAQIKPPEDGREFRRLAQHALVEAPPDKIEVVDFFWYSCPHCNAFEPKLEAWTQRLPANVSLRRVPAAFRDDMVPQQRLFYTLEAMGKIPQMQRKVFEAIHNDHVNLTRPEIMAEWVGQQGLDAHQFTQLYNSFSISAKARGATELQNQYDLEGVPAMGVAGRWYTDGTLAGTNERMLQVVDYLIAEAPKVR